ncbi:MAG TPA: flagellar basal body rod protein FlgC [Gaiellales bacterium]|jgi:flagellar basal-body rod protein FlgC|nr:flagellar basal body rod protein FlgC [Gaiellales bacterium]
MGMFDALSISSTGMSAERLRMDVIAENLANAETTRTPEGGPYRRQEVVLEQASPSFGEVLGGVRVAGIVSDSSPARRVYDPGHPDADKQGYVTLPNVNPVNEMVDLITAQRGYEANVTAMSAAKQMFTKTLDVLR